MAKSELDLLLGDIQKSFGAGSILDLSRDISIRVDRIPISSPSISAVLGGGIPRGRILELYGPESVGKTSLACYLAGQVQLYDVLDVNGKFLRKGKVLYIDSEHAIDLEYAKTFDFNTDEILFSQPNSGEQALNIVQKAVNSGLIDLIIVDSVPALVPEAVLEGNMEDQQMAPLARLMSKAMGKLTATTASSKSSILFINQLRTKLGFVMGNPECVTPDTLVEIEY